MLRIRTNGYAECFVGEVLSLWRSKRGEAVGGGGGLNQNIVVVRIGCRLQFMWDWSIIRKRRSYDRAYLDSQGLERSI